MRDYGKDRHGMTGVVRIVCDLCGAETNDYCWGEAGAGRKFTEVWMSDVPREGEGNRMEYKADICPDCFLSKLIPWLEADGCRVEWKPLIAATGVPMNIGGSR